MNKWASSAICILAAIFLMAIMPGIESVLGAAAVVVFVGGFIAEFGYFNIVHYLCIQGLHHVDRGRRRQAARDAALMTQRVRFLEDNQ